MFRNTASRSFPKWEIARLSFLYGILPSLLVTLLLAAQIVLRMCVSFRIRRSRAYRWFPGLDDYRDEAVSLSSVSLAMIFSSHRGDTSAVHENDLPDASVLLQESRFQPILACRAGAVSNAPFVDVGDPSRVPADVNVWFRHIPFITLPRGMLFL